MKHYLEQRTGLCTERRGQVLEGCMVIPGVILPQINPCSVCSYKMPDCLGGFLAPRSWISMERGSPLRPQELGYLEMPLLGSDHERCLALRAGLMDRCALLYEEMDRLEMPVPGRDPERCLALVIGLMDLGLVRKQVLDHGQVALLGSDIEGRSALTLSLIDQSPVLEQ